MRWSGRSFGCRLAAYSHLEKTGKTRKPFRRVPWRRSGVGPPTGILPLERLRQAVLRKVWQDTDDLATTDRRLSLLPEFYAEEIGMGFRKNLQ